MGFEVLYPRLRRTVELLREDGFGIGEGKMDFQTYMDLQTHIASELVRVRTKHLVTGIQEALHKENPYGVFNLHTEDHIHRVETGAHQFLDLSEQINGREYSKTERTVCTTIARLHDLGNLIDRENQSWISARLFRSLFKNFSLDDRGVSSILYGIGIHAESVGRHISDFADLPRDLYLDAILAVIIADKLDIGRHRLSPRLEQELPKDIETIELEVPHTLINLPIRECRFNIVPDGKSATIELDFSSHKDQTNDKRIDTILQNFLHTKGLDIYVPQKWHRGWREQGIPYIVPYFSLVEWLYCERLAILTSCLFALFPTLETIEFGPVDDIRYVDRKYMQILRRYSWQEPLYNVWRVAKERDGIQESELKPPAILARGKELYEKSKERERTVRDESYSL